MLLGCCYVVPMEFYAFLRHCYVVMDHFQGVIVHANLTTMMLGCCYGDLGGSWGVAKVFWVVTRVLLNKQMQYHSCL